MKKLLCSITLLMLLVNVVIAQKGTITGTIIDDSNNETLIGATIMIEGTTIGASSDIDGKYEIKIAPGTYAVSATYVSYLPQEVMSIVVKANELTTLNFGLKPESKQLETVVVTATVRKQSAGSVVALQQKSASFVTGIAADDIKKAPDRTTSDVLKRVSGTSIQDNKFVIIRGLADRYNTALINGMALPSTEPDKRAFAFDIFPSNLLDNLLIYKTATADLPGEFAGGIILLNTKEIPDEGFTFFNASVGYNTQSTFKPYQDMQKDKWNWTGLDNGKNNLPSAFPSTLVKDENVYNNSKLIGNDWKVSQSASMRPTQSFQFSTGRNFGKIGLISALTYNNSMKLLNATRADYDANTELTNRFLFNDVTTKENISGGALLNVSYKINKLNKVQFNNVYSYNTESQFTSRTGYINDLAANAKAYSMFNVHSNLLTSQLIGEHSLEEGKMKMKWGLSYNNTNRNTPSYRRMLYTQSIDDATLPFTAQVPNSFPSPNYAGRFYGLQNEVLTAATTDFTIPFALFSKKHNIKVGFLAEQKTRDYKARVLGYVGKQTQELLIQDINTIFDAQNINENGFRLRESSQKSDSYDAKGLTLSSYAMSEVNLSEKLRLVAGVRMERYNQQLNTFKIQSDESVNVNNTVTDFLPSLNLTFTPKENTNFRFSASKTVARPNFRELAYSPFYDFLLNRSITGNPNLERTKIINLDAKYEIFPGANQMIAFSVFYKYFNKPIEQIYDNGTKDLTFNNAISAQNYGAELELRCKLSTFAKNWNQSENITLFSNLAYIYSEVDQSDLPGAIRRGLQGQSPYIINGGVTYSEPKSGIATTFLVNRIGRRIWLVGQDQYKHTFEAPRTVLDWQVSKTFGKKIDLKLNISDILNQFDTFYQDQNENGRYDKNVDTKINQIKFGSNVSLAVTYKF